MDITSFFWEYINYDMGYLESISPFQQNIFQQIPKGDLLLNTRVLNPKYESEYLYYDSWERLIGFALQTCEGVLLKKIEHYMEQKEHDTMMMDAFTLDIS